MAPPSASSAIPSWQVLTLLAASLACLCVKAAAAAEGPAGAASAGVPGMLLLYALGYAARREIAARPLLGLYLCGAVYLLGWPHYFWPIGQLTGLLRAAAFFGLPAVGLVYFFSRCVRAAKDASAGAASV